MDKNAIIPNPLAVPQSADEAESFRRFSKEHPEDEQARAGIRFWDDTHPPKSVSGILTEAITVAGGDPSTVTVKGGTFNATQQKE